MNLKAFVLTSYSTEYYKWLKNNKDKITPYILGRRFEYAVMKKLRSLNYYCVRKFGSKGFEDIGATKNPVLVQCKWSRYRDTRPEDFDLKGLINLAKQFKGVAVFAGVRKHRMYFKIWKNGEWKEWTPS